MRPRVDTNLGTVADLLQAVENEPWLGRAQSVTGRVLTRGLYGVQVFSGPQKAQIVQSVIGPEHGVTLVHDADRHFGSMARTRRVFRSC